MTREKQEKSIRAIGQEKILTAERTKAVQIRELLGDYGLTKLTGKRGMELREGLARLSGELKELVKKEKDGELSPEDDALMEAKLDERAKLQRLKNFLENGNDVSGTRKTVKQFAKKRFLLSLSEELAAETEERAGEIAKWAGEEEIDDFMAGLVSDRMAFYAGLEESVAEAKTGELSPGEKAESVGRLAEAFFDQNRLKNKLRFIRERILRLKEIRKNRPDLDGPLLQDMIAQAINDKEKVKEELRIISDQSIEAFLGVSLRQIREYKKQLTAGQLVETPWILEKKEEIIELLQEGRNVFLFGETGTGKTEISGQIAKEITGKDAEIMRGHRFMTPEEVWGYLGLSPQTKKIDDAEISRLIMAKQGNLEESDLKGLIEVCKEAMAGRGPSAEVVTKFFLGPLARAMKEGRILIIDEANYVPPGLAASINEILANAQPGKSIKLPISGEEIVIAQGFGIIMTGNIAFDSIKRYKERYEIDPALKDRVKFIEYNTPPQETDRSKGYKDAVSKDLFLIGLADLVDRQGNLSLPGGELGLGELWRLCQAFKFFQDNFAGKQISEYKDRNGAAITVPLIKNHASMRKFRNILAGWSRDGFKHELDYYVWKELVEPSLNDPVEAAYFYQQMQKIFDFFNSADWDKSPDYGEGGKLIRFDPRTPKKPNQAQDRKDVSMQDIAEAVQGKAMPTAIQPTEEEIKKAEQTRIMVEVEKEYMVMEEAWKKEWEELVHVCPIEEIQQPSASAGA